jgi:genome maintenance exonuclease 1
MKWNKKFEYPETVRGMVEGLRHYDINNEKLPSVTTILSKTQTAEKTEGLANWRARVGEAEATRIMDQAAARGTAMHSILEHHILGKNRLDLTDVGQQAHKMADVVIEKGLSHLDEIWGSEVALYYPELYAGATDLVGVYKNAESIIDFKQTNKPKRREWIEDYMIQLGAYAMAHNYVYQTKIQQGVVLMCSKDGYFQEFIVSEKEFQKYQHEWLKRVDLYYKNAQK